MSQTSAKSVVKDILALADIEINGSRPWDIQVHNDEFYRRILVGGSLAVGEAYMDGWWDSQQLDELFHKVLTAELDKKIRSKEFILQVVKSKVLNAQTKLRSQKVAKEHYDLGNDFYKHMLDKRMQYTCGYWSAGATNLDDAQEQKLDLVCRKLDIKKTDTVLELGGGWGGFAKYAAENYGCSVVSYNISAEQVAYAKKNCASLPVEIMQADYREATGQFDKVVSIGMCEHVGYKNYTSFIQLANRSLKPDGMFLLHTIGGLASTTTTDPWFDKYIFPNSMLPSVSQLTKAAEERFVLEDFHNFGADYDLTLMAWYKNFIDNWPQFEKQYGDRFYKMWEYYLLSCAGSFRARKNQLWQFVFSKGGEPGGYKPVR